MKEKTIDFYVKHENKNSGNIVLSFLFLKQFNKSFRATTFTRGLIKLLDALDADKLYEDTRVRLLDYKTKKVILTGYAKYLVKAILNGKTSIIGYYPNEDSDKKKFIWTIASGKIEGKRPSHKKITSSFSDTIYSTYANKYKYQIIS